jgi:regulation of enolase protein 1 (concanavalin A-like superfamily)
MPKLQWETEMRDDAEFTSAYCNGVSVITLRKADFFRTTFYTLPTGISGTFEEHYFGNLDKAKLEIQQQFDTFYNKYKPLFTESNL